MEVKGFINQIQTVNLEEMSDFQRIDRNLKTLIVSVAGTIPGSRGFGMPADITDLAPFAARNEFVSELDERAERYIPEIRIEDVEFEADVNGFVGLRVFVEPNREMEGSNDQGN